jgi:hypothetical protein
MKQVFVLFWFTQLSLCISPASEQPHFETMWGICIADARHSGACILTSVMLHGIEEHYVVHELVANGEDNQRWDNLAAKA